MCAELAGETVPLGEILRARNRRQREPRCVLRDRLEHRRFAEFSDACKRYRYIGLCYGAPGVGKTVSARHYANWDRLQDLFSHPGQDAAAVEAIASSSTVFYTAPVVGAPSVIAARKLRTPKTPSSNNAIARWD